MAGTVMMMKISRKQLAKLIKETLDNVVGFPVDLALKNRLSALKNTYIALYDEDDPSQAYYGIDDWIMQVNNAMHALERMVGKDLELFDFAADDVYEKLIDGRYHPDNTWFEGEVYDDEDQ